MHPLRRLSEHHVRSSISQSSCSIVPGAMCYFSLVGSIRPNPTLLSVEAQQHGANVPNPRQIHAYQRFASCRLVPTALPIATLHLLPVLVYRGMNCKFFCISLYCDTANGYNLNPCKLTNHSPEHEYMSPRETIVSLQGSALYLSTRKFGQYTMYFLHNVPFFPWMTSTVLYQTSRRACTCMATSYKGKKCKYCSNYFVLYPLFRRRNT